MSEKKRLLFEVAQLCACLRREGIDFIVCVNEGKKGKVMHNISTDVNVEDDHHYMDMLCSITETWWKANHKS